MDLSVPFKKEEMLKELGTVLLLYIRSTEWVLEAGVARRILDWPEPVAGGDGLLAIDQLDFDEVAKEEGQRLDLNRFSVYRTFADLYDYGVMGVLQSSIFPIASATEATFAMAFVFDCWDSQLLFEMQGGGTVGLKHCAHAARMSIARQVLGGGERCLVPMLEHVPDGFLSIPEVALLANMEEGSVRNAASGGKKPGSLRTVTREGKRVVPREAALSWLSNRKGFRKTQTRGELVDFDLRSRAFAGSWEASAFIWQRAQHLGIGQNLLAECVGPPASTDTAEFRVLELEQLCRPGVAEQVAELLRVDPRFLRLRLEECHVEERMHALRRDIEKARARDVS